MFVWYKREDAKVQDALFYSNSPNATHKPMSGSCSYNCTIEIFDIIETCFCIAWILLRHIFSSIETIDDDHCELCLLRWLYSSTAAGVFALTNQTDGLFR